MTDQTPAHGCTIGGEPAMPILIREHTQLVARLTQAEAELERAEDALARIVALAARKGVISIDAIRAELAIRCANCGREIENRGDPDMGGNHEIRWVHVPGGYSICHPQQTNSPRAEPKGRP